MHLPKKWLQRQLPRELSLQGRIFDLFFKILDSEAAVFLICVFEPLRSNGRPVANGTSEYAK